ncbi:uncharacterized protein At2g39920-like [Bidens hawaiensis]|uniref:uncharacterized protein At2g39920-like n=1 Tax=Bidens hawaiensis TaxID=980011 RepID=UPI0040497D4A
MSSYGHQMEREYSAQSVSSDERSDMGSEFRMESVVYMSSCAATIFVGALVIVGILMLTLLTALTVMLQSCQSREAGVIESSRFDHHHHHHHEHQHHHYDYDYCKMAALNAEEINNFEAYSLPNFCKDAAVKYIKEGHYMRELNNSVSLVENYFNGITANYDGHDVVLMDIDDFLPAKTLHTDSFLYGYDRYGCDDCVREAKHMKHVFLFELYTKLNSGGWSLILLSRKPETLRNATVDDLKAVGCGGWSKLIMRSDEGMKMDTRDYSLKQKMAIEAESYCIRGVISSHMDMLLGAFVKTQNFKLPNILPVAPTHAII